MITYGTCNQTAYLDAGEEIAKDFENKNLAHIVKKINTAFFDGGPFDIKSFSSLTSIEMPRAPCYIDSRNRTARVTITKEYSWSAILGYVEAIPFLGTPLAIINAIGHFFYMIGSFTALKRAVMDLKETKRTAYNVGRGASCHLTSKVFEAAVALTVHRNHLKGSLLSTIPFAKPIVRLAQGALYTPPAMRFRTFSR